MFDYAANATVVNPAKRTASQKLLELTDAYRAEVRARVTTRLTDARLRQSA